MVRCVARRVQHLEPELGPLDGVALADHTVGDDRGVLVDLLAVGEHLGARLLHQPLRARMVVGVRVRQHHPAHTFLHRRTHDRVDVLGDVGSRVDHRDLVDADEVRVGTGTGERSGVRRNDPANQR